MPRHIRLPHLLLTILSMTVLMAGCMAVTPAPSATDGSATTPEAAATQVTEEGGESFAMRDLAVDLSMPLELIYGPDDYLWITERIGKRVVRVNPADSSVHVALELPEAFQSASQDGLLGMALHPELLQGTGNDYVFLAYTYLGEGGTVQQPNRRAKIVRYTYDATTETLREPLEILTDLPGSGDHNSGKLLIGPDGKLYYTIGDQGNNQFDNKCLPILAQGFPTAEDVNAKDWSKYPGKVLRMNLDGSIPGDNPGFWGVQSHIFTHGHRNVQGIAFGPDGQLFASEQGPKSDDEINLLEASKNYGWPHIAGFKDDQGYDYGNWSEAADCSQLEFSDFEMPPSVPVQPESAWSHPDFVPPLMTFGTVEDGYNFRRSECAPQEWICWPTVAPTGASMYVVQENGVPGWTTSLLVTALKTGTVYRMALSEDGRSLSGEAIPYFKTINRYRDVAVGPDGRTFYVITDSANWTVGADGLPTNVLENPGTVLEFTYAGE